MENKKIDDLDRQLIKLLSVDGRMPAKEIAKNLNRSVRTIEEHRSNIMHRMGVNNLVELAKEAVKLGLG